MRQKLKQINIKSKTASAVTDVRIQNQRGKTTKWNKLIYCFFLLLFIIIFFSFYLTLSLYFSLSHAHRTHTHTELDHMGTRVKADYARACNMVFCWFFLFKYHLISIPFRISILISQSYGSFIMLRFYV